MNTYERPSSSCRSSSRFTTPAWIDTSSAETGSSSTSTSGLSESARAMPMRWRCPPENSCGNRFTCSGLSPTFAISSRTWSRSLPRLTLVNAHRLRDDRTDRHARVERRVRILEDDLDLAAHRAQRASLLLEASRRRRARTEPDVGSSEPQQQAAGRGSCRSPTPPPARASDPVATEKLTPDTAFTVVRRAAKEATADGELLHEVGDLEHVRRGGVGRRSVAVMRARSRSSSVVA